MRSKFDSSLAHQQTAEELKEYIHDNSIDLHCMNLQQFRWWLNERILEANTQEQFRLRCRIRDIRAAHRRRITDRERRFEEARRAYESAPATIEYEQSSREVDSLHKGVAGLKTAVSQRRADPEKLVQFEKRLVAAQARLAASEIELNTPEKKRLDRAWSSLQRLREEIGLSDAETRLGRNHDQQGSASTTAGSRFEEISSRAASDFIVPKLGLAHQKPVILHGATLDCPQGELDQIIITVESGGIAKVHAVVEAKNNINDLAHGFRVRQENLAWFVGDTQGYETTRYRTSQFPDGQFKGRIVNHHEKGINYQFDSTSFDLFRPLDKPPYRLSRLYFVTEQRPLLGLDNGDLNRLLHRIATDHRFDIHSNTKLKRLYEWLLDFVAPVQTVDILRQYAESDSLAGNIITVQLGSDCHSGENIPKNPT